jgi:hypothetical protein
MQKYLIALFFCISLVFHSNSFGQSIVRSSLSSLGMSYSNEGIIIRQTIGQSSNTAVISTGAFVLRQGFQQPVSSRKLELIISPIEFSLSPNPAHEKTLLKIQGEISSYSIIISNINGIRVFMRNDQVLLLNWLDLNSLLPGIYIVTIVGDKRFGSQKLIISY